MSEISSVARVLGRIPCGLYIVAAAVDGVRHGFVASFLMQVGFEPPTICVAVGRTRPSLEALRRSVRFAVSILDAKSTRVMTPFLRRHGEGQSPFDQVSAGEAAGGSPVVEGALAWFECLLRGEHETGDHSVLFGEVVEARLQREGDPAVHLRKNGLQY